MSLRIKGDLRGPVVDTDQPWVPQMHPMEGPANLMAMLDAAFQGGGDVAEVYSVDAVDSLLDMVRVSIVCKESVGPASFSAACQAAQFQMFSCVSSSVLISRRAPAGVGGKAAGGARPAGPRTQRARKGTSSFFACSCCAVWANRLLTSPACAPFAHC